MDVRVAIVQPLVPHYRVPVFESLARQPGLSLTVVADLAPRQGSLTGIVHSEVFELRHSPYTKIGPFFKQDGMMAVAGDPEFDVVVFEWSSRRYQLPGAIKVARRAGKGIALWGHGFGTTMPWLGNLFRNRLVATVDVCILYGETAKESLIRKGYEAEKLFVAPNAVDQTPIRLARAHWRLPGRLEAFQRQNGIEGTPLVLYISRLEPEKRPELLLDALVRVRAERPDTQLVFIGEGDAQASLEAKAVRMGLKEAVRFLGAEYDETRIAPWTLSSVCLVQPERLGLSIVHAFGYGLPVITNGSLATHGPEVEVLEDGVNGMWYRRGDVADLAARILGVINDPILRERLSEGARRTVNGPEGRDVPAMVSGFGRAVRAAAERAKGRA